MSIDGSESRGGDLLKPAISFRISTATAFGAISDGLYAAELALGALQRSSDLVIQAKAIVEEAIFGSRDHTNESLAEIKVRLKGLSEQSFNGESFLNDSLIGSGVKNIVTSAKIDARGAASIATSPLDTKQIAIMSDKDPDIGILTRAYRGYHLLTSGAVLQPSDEILISSATTFGEIDNMNMALDEMYVGLQSAQRYMIAFHANFGDLGASFADVASPLLERASVSISSTDSAKDAAIAVMSELRRQALSLTYGVPDSAAHIASLLR
jgi:hypothetical protein